MSPNAAGALWIMIAKNTMKESPGIVDDAPIAIPSANAWMRRPRVVENEPPRPEGSEELEPPPVDERSESVKMLEREGAGGGAS